MKTCACCGKKYPDDAVICDVDRTPLGTGISEYNGPVSSQPASKRAAVCPACGAYDCYKPAIELRGSFNVFVFLAGGLFAVLFHNAGRPRRVQCNQCGALFNIRTRSARVSRVIFWLLVAPTVISIIILLLLLLCTFFAR